MKDLLRIFRLVRPYWAKITLNISANLLAAIFSVLSIIMVVPFLRVLFERKVGAPRPTDFELSEESVTQWFNYYFSDLLAQNGEFRTLIILCAAVVLMFLMKNLFYYLALFFLAPVRTSVLRDLRNRLYKHLLILPLSFYSERKKGDLMSRTTSDVQEVEWSIMRGFELFFREPVSLIFFLGTLIMMSPRLSIFVFILLPLAGLLIGRIAKSLRRRSGKAQALLGRILARVEESISGLRIIKAFNAEQYSKQAFQKLNQSYTRVLISITRRSDLSAPLSEFLGVIILVTVLWFGGRLVINEGFTLGPEVFITYLIIFSQMITPAKNLATAYYQVQKGSASLDRIEEILDAHEVIIEKEDARPIKTLHKGIVIKDLSFRYETELVLKNIDLEINKGDVVALVGPSGAGKSTLVDLIPRFYDPTAGQIVIDDSDIRDYRIDELRGLMGIVSQDTILFNDTVFNNISFGSEAFNQDEVREAARIANADEFINEMPEGYDTIIGDRGVLLSGGQRQRLSIARAVLRNPPILILDEATSALDTVSERLVQEAINRIMKDRTVIVIAHRLSTIRSADKIVVMKDGEITEMGKHDELLTKKGVYAHLNQLQNFR